MASGDKVRVLLVALLVVFAIIVPATWPSRANLLADDDGTASTESDDVKSDRPAEPSKAESTVVKAARQGFEAARAAYETDTLPLETLAQWSERLLERGPCGIDSERPPGRRTAPFTAHEATAGQGYGSARSGRTRRRGGKKALMDYYVADAERRLAEIDAEQTNQTTSRTARQGFAGADCASAARGATGFAEANTGPKRRSAFSERGKTETAPRREKRPTRAHELKDVQRMSKRSVSSMRTPSPRRTRCCKFN